MLKDMMTGGRTAEQAIKEGGGRFTGDPEPLIRFTKVFFIPPMPVSLPA